LLERKGIYQERYFGKQQDFSSKKPPPNDPKQSSPHLLRSIRIKLAEENDRESKFRVLVWITSPVVAVGLILLSVYLFRGARELHVPNNPVKTSARSPHIPTPAENEREYAFLLSDGKKWLKEGHFHNAGFQFDKAYTLFPERIESAELLIHALLLDCEHNGESCAEAAQFVHRLDLHYPFLPQLASWRPRLQQSLEQEHILREEVKL